MARRDDRFALVPDMTDEEIDEAMDKAAAEVEPFDSYDAAPAQYVDDIPPGEQRDLAERALAELRARQERETGDEPQAPAA